MNWEDVATLLERIRDLRAVGGDWYRTINDWMNEEVILDQDLTKAAQTIRKIAPYLAPLE